MNYETNLTEEERKKELKILKVSYDMYEADKKDMIKKRKEKKDKDGNRVYSDESIEKTLELMNTMQQDIRDKYIKLGGTEEELMTKSKSRNSNKAKLEKLMESDIDTQSHKVDKDILDIIRQTQRAMDKKEETVVSGIEKFPEINDIEENIKSVANVDKNVTDIPNKVAFDSIPIPSKGQCYRHKMDKIPVGYLTAYDENLIVSPNLYRDNAFLDYLLKAKIMSSKIDPDELLPGDRDAIILWLRASGYGPEYPITVTDSATGEKFESTIDLTTIKYRPFTLVGDENGYFDFTLPFSKDKIKFKFLNQKETKALAEMEKDNETNINRKKVTEYADILKEVLDGDEDIDRGTKIKVNNAIKEIENYAKTFSNKDTAMFSHTITNKLMMSIMEINGNTDKKFIRDYIMTMAVKDSSALRRYILDNEPGVDFNITVERPESLGGGSLDTFLQLDQFVFLNIL